MHEPPKTWLAAPEGVTMSSMPMVPVTMSDIGEKDRKWRSGTVAE
jgi:hypothetical protein